MNGWVTLFSEPWTERLGWVLIHFLWQGTGIALLLAAALRGASRVSSHNRYVMIGSAFLLCAVLPVATWVILGPQASSSIASAKVLTPMAVPYIESPVLRGSVPLTDGTMELPSNFQTRWQDNLSRVADASLPYVVGLWFGGVLILTFRLTMGWILMRRLCFSGLPIHNSFYLERFRGLLERMQVGVPVRLLESALVEVPTLIGWLRPTILVPVSVLIGLTPDQFEAILAHELAHVRRYDYLVNLFQTVIETVLFYHPAVWWISRKLREERENCCDDIALEVMQDRLVYVSALAQLEEGRAMPLALTASGGSLLHRIRRIAGANDRKVSAFPLAATVLILIAVVGFSIRTTQADASTTVRLSVDTKPPALIPTPHSPTDAEIQVVEVSQTPLMKAFAQQAHVRTNIDAAKKYAEARTLLAQGADVNAEDKMGNTPLTFFILYAGANEPYPLDILQTLLERAKNPNPLCHAEFSTPPRADHVLNMSLMAAVFTDPAHRPEQLAAVQMLLSHGAMFTNSEGNVESLLQAASRGDLPAIQKLIEAGTPINSVDSDGWSPLLITIALDYDDAANWLIDHGANVNAVTSRGAEDPLTYAADRGHDELVEKLIAHGAKPDRAWRGLKKAVDRNDQRLFDDLIKAGVDMTGAGGIWNSASGKTWRQITADPLYTCIDKNQTAMAVTLLNKGVEAEPAGVSFNQNYAYWAVHFERPEILQALLNHGANPLLKSDQGETPLSLAQKSHPKLVPMLQAAISHHQTKSETSIEGNSALTKALIAAAQQGNVAQVSQLLKQGADPKLNLSSDQTNALFVAAENNQVEVLKLLLQNGADPNCANSCGNAPIDWTLSRGHLEAATVLHDAGAKISPEDWAAATGDLATLRALANSGVLKKGKTDGAMHYATSMGQLEAVKFLESIEGKPVAGKFLAQAARSGNIPMLDYILSRGANIKTDGGDAMDQAIIFFNQPESVKWLLAHGVDPNHFSKWNEFSLAECRSAEMVKILLDAGANPNGQGDGNDDMGAPLVHAPDAESVRLLVQHGANLKPKFKDGYTLIDIVTSRNSEDRSKVIAELIKEGAEFDPKGNGATALARAAAWNHLDTMQVLLDHGVSPSAYSDEPFMHCSALNNASNEPSPEAVKFLLDHGADPNGDPRDTNTPLGYAVMCGQKENVEILRKAGAHDVGDLSIAAAQGDIGKISDLLKSGANINETDHAGNTPLYYSVRRGHPEVTRLLIQNGANVNPFNLWGQTAQGEFELELAIQGPNRSELDWGVPEDEGNRRRAIFKELFAKYSVNPSYQDSHGRTALHQSAFAGNSELNPLRDFPHPACLNLLDNDGNTPLILAALSPQASELVTKISDSDPKHPDKSRKDWNGAAYIADRLIKAGAKLDLKMPNGQTQGEVAMAAAVKAKNPQLISVLHDAGVAESISAPKSDASTPPASAASATGDSTIKAKESDPDEWTISNLKVSDMPLTEFAEKLTAMTKSDDPKGVGVVIDVKVPPGEAPLKITYGYPPYTGDLGNLLYRLADLYPIRYELQIASRNPDSRQAPITLTQLPAAEAQLNKKAGQTKIDLDFNGTDIISALKAVQSQAAAKGFSFDLNTDALQAQLTTPITIKARGWSVQHALLSISYLADVVSRPLVNFTGYRLIHGSTTELHDRTSIRFGICNGFFKVDATKAYSHILASLKSPSGENRVWGPSEVMPAYSYFYRGKDVSPSWGDITTQFSYHHKDSDSPGFVVPVDGAPFLDTTFQTYIVDKTHVRASVTVRLKKPDGTILREFTGEWTAASGTVLSLVTKGAPLMLNTPDDPKTKSSLYILAQADYVDSGKRETDIEPQQLELVSPTNTVQEVELSETPVKSAPPSTPKSETTIQSSDSEYLVALAQPDVPMKDKTLAIKAY